MESVPKEKRKNDNSSKKLLPTSTQIDHEKSKLAMLFYLQSHI